MFLNTRNISLRFLYKMLHYITWKLVFMDTNVILKLIEQSCNIYLKYFSKRAKVNPTIYFSYYYYVVELHFRNNKLHFY